ncbi:MAG: glutathione binding-like protein [Kofleriaceae bacterium]
MELYFAPLACSLATRIALYDANISATFNQVDLARRRTADDRDFLTLNPLGQVPTLRTESGDILTENGAILQYVADSAPASGLAPTDRVGRAKLHQWLSFLGTELHKGIFALQFDRATTDALTAYARTKIASRFAILERHLTGREFLLDQFTVADAYLTTLLNWTRKTGPNLADWPALAAYHQRMLARPSVARAVAEEFALYTAELAHAK